MDPFLGEVRMFTWPWAPRGWALCDGTRLPIGQNAALNALLGNTYGGDLQNYFNLPDLRGRTPVHVGRDDMGNTYSQGEAAGVEAVTLQTSQLPAHYHQVTALSGTKANAATSKSGLPATVNVAAASTITVPIYGVMGKGQITTLNPGTLSSTGGGGPHNNVQPFLVMNFCIATTGIFPPRQ